MRFFTHCGVVALGAALAVGASAQNVSVTDYDVPESRAERMLVDLAANHATEGSNTTTSNANIGVLYKRFYDSLPFGYAIDANGSGETTRDPGTEEYTSLYNAKFAGSVKRYIWDKSPTLKDIFGSARFDGSYQKDDDQPATSVTLGVGYGRFINATALAKAVRVERFLLDEGEIVGNMPKDSVVELGHIIEREAEYQDLYGDTYKKEWFREMEGVVRRSGVLKADAIGAIGILRMDEVVTRERIADRFYGWDLAVGSKFDVTLADSDLDLPPANLDVSIDFARPISWEWQVNGRLNWSSPFNSTVNEVEYGFGKRQQGSAAVDVTYELTNRVDFRARYAALFDKPEVGDTELTHSAGASLIYYLENQVTLVASEQIEKARDKDATTNFTLTLNYRVF